MSVEVIQKPTKLDRLMRNIVPSPGLTRDEIWDRYFKSPIGSDSAFMWLRKLRGGEFLSGVDDEFDDRGSDV